jgi:hypothetical protein
MRYQTTNQRAFHTALKTLTKLQNQRKKDEIGFEPRKQYLKQQIAQVKSTLRGESLDSPTPGQPDSNPNAAHEILQG